MSATVVIVTGASHGIGALTAETLAWGGHRVYAGVRGLRKRNCEACERLRELARAGLPIESLELDVTDDESVADAVDRVLAAEDRIDVVVNNAGSLLLGVTEAFTIDQARDQLEVNVLGPGRMNRAALPHMRAQGSGLLVHVSSIAGRLTLPCHGLYCASKYALEALAEAYRYELSPLGVDSVIVEPGPFPTNLLASAHGPDDGERTAAYPHLAAVPDAVRTGLHRMFVGDAAPHPQDVADAIVELIETPPGQRPLRTVVGRDFGAASVNEATEPHAQAALQELRLGSR